MDLLTPRVADPGPPPLIDNVFTYTVIALTCDWANGKLLYGQIENLIRNEFGEWKSHVLLRQTASGCQDVRGSDQCTTTDITIY
jgi:hypothetical protein